jgi:class 3 adenylate cyclase
MALPRVIPALADLTQDIAGPVPLDLLQNWAAGTQDLERAGSLLEGFRIEGCVVSSDTSGLSKLTAEEDLLDVLALISAPKEILHAIGIAIGGKAIGTWVADNTQMYYPTSIAPDLILAGMSEAQVRIAASVSISVGMCVHGGVFYELGGGLYGRDADVVEQLAEHNARGGEVLVTTTVTDRLVVPRDFAFQPRPELSAHYGAGVLALEPGPRLPDIDATDRRYPHPYPVEFFERLAELRATHNGDALRRDIYATYLDERVILFLARERETATAGGLASLLDGLVTNALMDTIVRGMAGSQDHLAGLGGGIAILAFDSSRQAFDYAQAVRARFTENGLLVKIGIDRGQVLRFSNTLGPSGIAGDAVNIASKISEDAGVAGAIHLTTRVASALGDLPGSTPFQLTVSNVSLTGVSL